MIMLEIVLLVLCLLFLAGYLYSETSKHNNKVVNNVPDQNNIRRDHRSVSDDRFSDDVLHRGPE